MSETPGGAHCLNSASFFFRDGLRTERLCSLIGLAYLSIREKGIVNSASEPFGPVDLGDRIASQTDLLCREETHFLIVLLSVPFGAMFSDRLESSFFVYACVWKVCMDVPAYVYELVCVLMVTGSTFFSNTEM